MKQIKYGYIAPIAYQHLIPESATFHLILAHLLDNEDYVSYYKSKIERGDTVILDNSAFEFKRALSAEEIFGFIERSGLQPTYVVAPDYPFQPWEVTWESTLSFIEQAKDKPYKIMAVPQSVKGDWKGWISGYRKMLAHPGIGVIGMSILGIPNAFCSYTGTEDVAYNRIFATQFLLNHGITLPSLKWHHYLGLGGGPRELLIQRSIGLIDSNDSSSPFWHGYLDIKFDDSLWGLCNGKSKLEVDFNAPYIESKADSIRYNVDYMEQKILGINDKY